jgi:asparagine synthase (glutamine-hydrolysing)
LSRWSLVDTVRGLLRPGDVKGWWRAQATNLAGGPADPRVPLLGWGSWPLRAPSWVTPKGIELARQALLDTAERAEPLAADPGQHQTLLVVRTTAPRYAMLARLFAEFGVHLDMPYFDDRVVESVLAVRPHERVSPWRYKPLLSEAMRGVVPDAVLGRATKGEFSEDVRRGFRTNLPAILNLFADSTLSDQGLINCDELRNRLLAPRPDNTVVVALESLIGCETWLRAVSVTDWRFRCT